MLKFVKCLSIILDFWFEPTSSVVGSPSYASQNTTVVIFRLNVMDSPSHDQQFPLNVQPLAHFIRRGASRLTKWWVSALLSRLGRKEVTKEEGEVTAFRSLARCHVNK